MPVGSTLAPFDTRLRVHHPVDVAGCRYTLQFHLVRTQAERSERYRPEASCGFTRA